MNSQRLSWLIALALCLLGAASHLLPHPAGISTVGVIGMLAAAYLPKHLMPLPVLVSVAVFDAIYGVYAIGAMSVVYVAHLASAAGVSPILRQVKASRVGCAAVVSAVIFYLISNAAPVALGFYSNTVSGWLACYVAGIPFLLRGIAANLIFAAIAFTAIRGLSLMARRWALLPH